METEFERKVAALLKRESRYRAEAYFFIADAVNFTVSEQEKSGHVSAAQLLDGIRKFAGQKFGVVAVDVLADWGMADESDAGEVVYLLIGAGLLRASEDDRREDFDTGRPLFPPPPACRVVRRKGDELPLIDREG